MTKSKLKSGDIIIPLGSILSMSTFVTSLSISICVFYKYHKISIYYAVPIVFVLVLISKLISSFINKSFYTDQDGKIVTVKVGPSAISSTLIASGQGVAIAVLTSGLILPYILGSVWLVIDCLKVVGIISAIVLLIWGVVSPLLCSGNK